MNQALIRIAIADAHPITIMPQDYTYIQLINSLKSGGLAGLKAKPVLQIADEIFRSHRTVVNYRTRIMRKLDCNNIATLVKRTLQSGLAK